MKQVLFIILMTSTLASASLSSITKAISNGDADNLGQFFDQSVEIAVLDEEDVYSKAQAIKVVKDFFSQNPPKSFSQVHKGVSAGKDAQYCIGNLITNSQATYRVYIYMKSEGSQQLIQELRFDKE